MNKIKKYYYKIIYRFSNKIRVRIAREIGVNFLCEKDKEDCLILTDPLSLFGTEPYLVTVGHHCEFTLGVRMITHDGGMWTLRYLNTNYKNVDYFDPITIGNNVFIGNNAIILPGVNIGNNCVIGAGSIVTKNIPDNSVYAGVPARFIKTIDEYMQKAEKGIMTKGLSHDKKQLLIRNHYCINSQKKDVDK